MVKKGSPKSLSKPNQATLPKPLVIKCQIQRYADTPWLYLAIPFCKKLVASFAPLNFQWLKCTSKSNHCRSYFVRPLPNHLYDQTDDIYMLPGLFYTDPLEVDQTIMEFEISPIKYKHCERVVIEIDQPAICREDWSLVCTAFNKVPLTRGLQTRICTPDLEYNLTITDLEPSDEPCFIHSSKTDVSVRLKQIIDPEYEFIYNRELTALLGVEGVGKSFTIESISLKLNIPLITLYEISELEEILTQLDFLLEQCDYVILYVKEIDKLAPRTGCSAEQMEFAEKLAKFIDPRISIVVSAINVTDVYELLKFKRILPIKPPPDRTVVINNIWPMKVPLDPKIIEYLVKMTNGYLPIDLHKIISHVVLKIIKVETKEKEDPSTDELQSLFDTALKLYPPTLLKDFRVSNINFTMSQLGGLFKVKPLLEQYIEWPLTKAADFKEIGLNPPRGILLYGPPGCSKTCIAKAVASQNNFTFCTLNVADVYSAFVGESERLIREVFMQAKLAQPAIIFIDEIDAIVGKRQFGSKTSDQVQERILTTFLTEMDGVDIEKNDRVMILAATNRIECIDEALRRPGRFDVLIHVDLPDRLERIDILQVFLRESGKIVENEARVLDWVAANTDNWSGADLKNLFMRIKNQNLTRDDFEQAFESVSQTRIKQ
jgi:transitional endoplasmic reticulum ATPase